MINDYVVFIDTLTSVVVIKAKKHPLHILTYKNSLTFNRISIPFSFTQDKSFLLQNEADVI